MAERRSAPATPTIKELINELKWVPWYSLGINLDLEISQLNIIDSNYRGNDERCKTEVLSCWLYKQATPNTWEAIAKALNLMGEYKVERVIRKKYITPTATEATEEISASLSATSLQRPFVAIEECSIQKLKGKFSKLVIESCRRLRERKISVKDFQLFLVTLCSSCDSRGGDDMVATNVESAQDLDEIFRALSKNGFWDYLKYYPLQNIIEQFASDDDELKDKMEEYQKDLSGHTLALGIQRCMFLDANDQVQKISVFTLPADVADHSLNYVKSLWRSLENQFSLPKLEEFLHDTSESTYSSHGPSLPPSQGYCKNGTTNHKHFSQAAYSEGDAGGAFHGDQTPSTGDQDSSTSI